MSDSTESAPTTPHSPGLPGVPNLWAAIAQLGSVVLMGAMFWQSQQAWFTQVREDRTMVQRELDRVHSDMEKTWNAIRDQQRSIEGLAKSVTDSQNTTRDLITALRDLTAEVKKTKTP